VGGSDHCADTDDAAATPVQVAVFGWTPRYEERVLALIWNLVSSYDPGFHLRPWAVGRRGGHVSPEARRRGGGGGSAIGACRVLVAVKVFTWSLHGALVASLRAVRFPPIICTILRVVRAEEVAVFTTGRLGRYTLRVLFC